MNHVSLALKYRPLRFEDLAGQEQVTGPLSQAVLLGRIAPAYLFSGPRGSGKTTTARVLARALNCKHRQGFEPCNTCESCLSILNGSSMDVIEIDGASNRGIDDIRDIRERVRYAPAGGGKKVYIVDEVHMLTEQAFNAFLKTLEEPPPHVVFVFATTDPNDLLETVRSRCQRYEFHRITVATAHARLRHIAAEEKLEVEEGALAFLARRADGSLRDALVLLDQAAHAEPGLLTEARVRALLGHAGAEFYFQLSDAVEARNAELSLKLLHQALSGGVRETTLFSGLCEHFRSLMLARVSPSTEGLLEGTPEQIARYVESAARLPEEDLVQMLELCLEGAAKLERSAHPRFQLELLVVTLARLDSVKALENILARLEGGEAGPGGGARPSAPQAPPAQASPAAATTPPSPPVRSTPQSPPTRSTPPSSPTRSIPASPPTRSTQAKSGAPIDVGQLSEFPSGVWEGLLERSKSRNLLGAFLGQAQLLGHRDGEVVVAVASEIHRKTILEAGSVGWIQETLAELGSPAARFTCVTQSGLPPRPDKGGPPVEGAPAAPQDPDLVGKVIQMFGGEVVG